MTVTGQMVSHVRSQAEARARLGSPLCSLLLTRLADDVETGGPGAQAG